MRILTPCKVAIFELPSATLMRPDTPYPYGMPRWRAAQRSMPVADKIELLGRFIRETRELEAIKKSCRKSVASRNASSTKAP